VATAPGFALFDTAVGRCGIAWTEHGVAGVQLPETNELTARAWVLRTCPGAHEATPPPDVARALDDITRLLGGEARDLTGVALDMQRVPAFNRRVYEVARTISPGTTLSYGEVAARLGDPGLARAVGKALAQNPFPIVVPCHRVVAADGRMGGFSAPGGTATKRRLLAIEGAPAGGPPTLF
jgi:methylated-DNA-[protein]-cysteine S-methyltransferase